MLPSALVIRYPFRVRAVSVDGEHLDLDHLEVDLGEAGIPLPTVRVEAEGLTDAQHGYLQVAAESAAIQAFIAIAISVSVATPASTRLAPRKDIPVIPIDPRWPTPKGPR